MKMVKYLLHLRSSLGKIVSQMSVILNYQNQFDIKFMNIKFTVGVSNIHIPFCNMFCTYSSQTFLNVDFTKPCVNFTCPNCGS